MMNPKVMEEKLFFSFIYKEIQIFVFYENGVSLRFQTVKATIFEENSRHEF